MDDDLIGQLRALYVWPQSVANAHAEILTPREVKMLYAVGDVAHEAADRIKQLEAALREIRKACANEGYGNPIVNERIVDRCDEIAFQALKETEHD